MGKLVDAVPNTWSWVDGYLAAPNALIASGQVARHTGFAIQRFHSVNPTIVGEYNSKHEWQAPDLLAVMLEQILPAFVSFDEGDLITLDLAKRFIMGFLLRGYRGSASFSAGCYDNDRFNNPARCSFAFEPWNGPPICGEEAGPQPARVKLEWDARYGGSEKSIAPIVAACRALQLHEYTPTQTRTTVL
jgi:hypothetical protein